MLSKALRWSALLVPLSVSIILPVTHGAPLTQTLLYLLYLALGVLAPGIAVTKALVGSRGSWMSDIVTGAVVGMSLQLVFWAAFTGLGIQSWLWCSPLLVLVPLLSWSKSRARVLERPTTSWPWWATWGTSLLISAFAVAVSNGYMGGQDLPPFTHTPYVDLPWHLGLSYEMTRSFPPQVPQVDVGYLHYSWFAHAHIGAGALMSGVELPLVLLRLWLVPILILAIYSIAMLAQQVSHSFVAAVLATALATSYHPFRFWEHAVGTFGYLGGLSPTMLFSAPVSVVVVSLAASFLVHRNHTWRWLVLIGLTGLLASGSKSSTMVVLFGAAFGTAVVTLVLKRARLQAWLLTVVFLPLTIFALKFVTGGGYGSGVQFGHILTFQQPYVSLFGRGAGTGLFPQHMLHAEGLGYWVLLSLSVALLLRAPLMAGVLFVPILRAMRLRPHAWLIGGVVAASIVFAFGMRHNGFSEIYFLYGAMPFAAVLVAWAFHLLTRGSKARAIAAGVSLGIGAALTFVFEFTTTTTPPPKGASQWLPYLQTMVFQFAALVIILVLLAILPKLRPKLSWARPVWLAFILGPVVAGSLLLLPRDMPIRPSSTKPLNPLVVSQGEVSDWISHHTDLNDLIATNSHCVKDWDKFQSCPARSFWLSGYGGRRALLDGWSYTEDGSDGVWSDTTLWNLNYRIFKDPTDESIAAAKARGVRWVHVQHAFGAPAPDLSRWADHAYSNAYQDVWRLR